MNVWCEAILLHSQSFTLKQCSRVHQNTPFSFRKFKSFWGGADPFQTWGPAGEGGAPALPPAPTHLGAFGAQHLPLFKIVHVNTPLKAYMHAFTDTRITMYTHLLLTRAQYSIYEEYSVHWRQKYQSFLLSVHQKLHVTKTYWLQKLRFFYKTAH